MIWSWNIWWREQKIEASIFLITLFNYSNYRTQLTQWCNNVTYWSRRILLILKLDASDRAYVKVLLQVHIHYDLHVVHWWSRRKQECCDLQKLTRQVVQAVIKLTQINLSYRDLHSDVSLVCCEVSRALIRRNLARALTRRSLATLTRLRTEASFFDMINNACVSEYLSWFHSIMNNQELYHIFAYLQHETQCFSSCKLSYDQSTQYWSDAYHSREFNDHWLSESVSELHDSLIIHALLLMIAI